MDNGFLSVPTKVWRNELGTEEKDFVVAWNSKIKHDEPIEEVRIPPKIKIIRRARGSDDRDRFPDVRDDQDENGSDEKDPKSNRKMRIRFNLDSNDKEE